MAGHLHSTFSGVEEGEFKITLFLLDTLTHSDAPP